MTKKRKNSAQESRDSAVKLITEQGYKIFPMMLIILGLMRVFWLGGSARAGADSGRCVTYL